MLVTRRGPVLKLITHPDHGRLAGQLGARWGNQRFAGPHPTARAAWLDAATHHDDGWAELDGQPAHNDQAWRPAHFLELGLEQTVGPYRRGVDSVYARDPHAGALVSMHWAGLYSTRWGLQSGSPVRHPLAEQVVAEEERRWVSALREAWGFAGLRSRFEADTWHAYELLRALDLLALALGLLDLERSTAGGRPLATPGTLTQVDQPPGGRIVLSVPLTPGGEHVDLVLRVAAPGRVVIDPYPFSDLVFALELAVRELEDRPYSATEASAAYHRAAIQPLRFTIGAAG